MGPFAPLFYLLSVFYPRATRSITGRFTRCFKSADRVFGEIASVLGCHWSCVVAEVWGISPSMQLTRSWFMLVLLLSPSYLDLLFHACVHTAMYSEMLVSLIPPFLTHLVVVAVSAAVLTTTTVCVHWLAASVKQGLRRVQGEWGYVAVCCSCSYYSTCSHLDMACAGICPSCSRFSLVWRSNVALSTRISAAHRAYLCVISFVCICWRMHGFCFILFHALHRSECADQYCRPCSFHPITLEASFCYFHNAQEPKSHPTRSPFLVFGYRSAFSCAQVNIEAHPNCQGRCNLQGPSGVLNNASSLR